MAKRDDDLLWYGGRLTYFPPFVHQLPSQCTMTAALLAANVAKCGRIEASQQEILRLARASGVATLPADGYNTTLMIAALRKRYGLDVTRTWLSVDDWRRRLAAGWVGLIAVRYPRLPQALKLAPAFTGNHRITIVGYDPETDSTRLLDPLANGARHRGVDVDVNTLYRAQGRFRAWQVWMREGQALRPDLRRKARFDPPRELTLKPRSDPPYRFWSRRVPGLPIERTPDKPLRLAFDAVGTFVQEEDGLEPVGGPFVRIAGGDRRLVGLWLRATDGVRADLDPEKPVTAAAVDEDDEPATSFDAGYLAGQADERERWEAWLETMPAMAGPASLIERIPDEGIGKDLG